MQAMIKGPWSGDEIAGFLAQSCYPVRLACVGSDGYPRVVSVWYLYEDGRLFGASHGASQLVAMLRADSKVGFEVATNEPPYFGVRGQGDAVVSEQGGDRMLERLLDRYLGTRESPLASWLLSRSEEEVLIAVTPRRLFSWDYRKRMGS